MKKVNLVLISLIFLISTSATALSQDKDIQHLYDTIEAMKTNPLDKKTKKMREKAFKWVVDTKKVSVVVCSDPIGPFMNKKNKAGSELLMAHLFGMAEFKLKNPDNKTEMDAQKAGIETALIVYEKMKEEKKKYRSKELDRMVELRDTGKLTGYVNNFDCK